MRGSAPRDFLASLGCRHWRRGGNIKINAAMIALTWTSRLAVNSTIPKSAVAIASASDPPSASHVAGPITNDRVLACDEFAGRLE
jgi:hypothetical protein